MRRYTRLSKGFSTLRVTPAMAAGVTTRLFDVMDLVNLLIATRSQKKPPRAAAYQDPLPAGTSPVEAAAGSQRPLTLIISLPVATSPRFVGVAISWKPMFSLVMMVPTGCPG
jgi:hypothetical protein